MYAIRRPVRTRYKTAKSILRSNMMQITQDKVPGKQKGGAYALLLNSGLVWLSNTTNYNQMLLQNRNRCNGPDCVKQAWERDEDIEIFLLTKPDLFCIEDVRQQLEEANLIAPRKTRDLTGSGYLYVVRHHTTHDYFVLEDRAGTTETSLLCNFMIRLKLMSNKSRNVVLNKFINEQAEDVLNERNFSIHKLDNFKDSEDAWLKRQVYIDDCKFGNNLNWNSVD